MVKPDLKVNYYAALELPTDASVDDIKKQYRKLALKYHPDRNPGKEEEFSPKFQSIQAAHEILGDLISKTKYDADRRKAGLYPTGSRPAATRPSSFATNNPSAAPSTSWAPPPRRTNDPTAWGRNRAQAGQSTPNGADRFSQFPRPTPTSKKDAEQERANVFNAWQNMNNARKQQATAQQQAQAQAQAHAQAQAQPSAPPKTTPNRPRVPPRQDTQYPSEEQIRAGMNYRQAPSNFASDAQRSAWAQFNHNNQSRPGMSRSASTRTPRKAGFDPSAVGQDEAAASRAGYNSRPVPPPPPPPFPPPPPGHPPQRPNVFGQAKPTNVETDVPYTEGTRIRTPYASHGGERTPFSSDQLRRSQSTRDTTKMNQEATAAQNQQNRHRSASPPKPSAPEPGSQRKPFVVYSASESSDDESDSSATSPEPYTKTTGKPNPSDANAFVQPRPKKTPTPPSRRFNATPPNNPASRATNQDDSNHDSGIGEKSEPQSMYDAFPFLYPDTIPDSEQQKWSGVFPFGPAPQKNDSKGTIPRWAFPSSVVPRCNRTSTRGKPAMSAQPVVNMVGGTTHREPALKSYVDKIAEAMGMTTAWNEQPANMISPSQRSESSGGVSLPSTPRGAKESSDQGFTMPINDETFQTTNHAKSRSEETINTAFSPSEWSKTFTGGNAEGIFAAPPQAARKPSPLKRGRDTLSARSSRGQMASPRTQNDGSRMPPPPISTANGVPQSAQEPSSAPLEDKFTPESWKDSEWDFNIGGSRPPSSAQTLRRSSTTMTGKSGQPSVQQARDNSTNPTATLPAPVIASTDAMDIDPVPTANEQQSTNTASKGPRLYAVPPSAWRQSQSTAGVSTGAKSRRSSNTPRKGSGVNLEELAQSLNGTTAGGVGGLDGMSNMTSNLPFTSQASKVHPTKTFESAPAILPQVPRAPDVPLKLTKQSWKTYCAATSQYLTAFHAFNKDMHVHFRESLMHEDKFVSVCPEALEAVGQAGEVNLTTYGATVKEDERFRECWGLAHEKHTEALAAFTGVKEKVRRAVEGGGLTDM